MNAFEKLLDFVSQEEELDEMVDLGMKMLCAGVPEVETIFQLDSEVAEKLQKAFMSAYASGLGQGYLKAQIEMEKENDREKN